MSNNWIPKSRWLSLCEICRQELNQSNSRVGSSPICDKCRETTPEKKLEKKWAEIREREGLNNQEPIKVAEANVPLVLKRKEGIDNSEKILWIVGGIFVIWLISAMISSRGDSSETYIDCRQPGWQNSPYCDGTLESDVRDQNGIESNFYQNIVR